MRQPDQYDGRTFFNVFGFNCMKRFWKSMQRPNRNIIMYVWCVACVARENNATLCQTTWTTSSLTLPRRRRRKVCLHFSTTFFFKSHFGTRASAGCCSWPSHDLLCSCSRRWHAWDLHLLQLVSMVRLQLGHMWKGQADEAADAEGSAGPERPLPAHGRLWALHGSRLQWWRWVSATRWPRGGGRLESILSVHRRCLFLLKVTGQAWGNTQQQQIRRHHFQPEDPVQDELLSCTQKVAWRFFVLFGTLRQSSLVFLFFSLLCSLLVLYDKYCPGKFCYFWISQELNVLKETNK